MILSKQILTPIKIKTMKIRIILISIVLLVVYTECDQNANQIIEDHSKYVSNLNSVPCPRRNLQPCTPQDMLYYAIQIRDELNSVLDCQDGPYEQQFPNYCQFASLWAFPDLQPVLPFFYSPWKFCQFAPCIFGYGCQINGEYRNLHPWMDVYNQDLVLEYAKDWAEDNNPFSDCICGGNTDYFKINFVIRFVPGRDEWMECFEDIPDQCYNIEIGFLVDYFSCCQPCQ